METWKPIAGFADLYEISNFATVRRIQRGKIFAADQIDHVKKMFSEGCSLSEAAEFLNTSITTAFNIKHGKTWSGSSAHRPIKTHVASDHYVRFSACRNGKYTKIAIHRAMWEAFVGPIPENMQINHKNLDRSDNRLENLELVTHRQNIKHAIDAYKERGLLRAEKGTKGFLSGKHSKYSNV